MKTGLWIAAAILSAVPSHEVTAQSAQSTMLAASEVYIQQPHGRVAPGSKVQKSAPEAAGAPVQGAGPTAPGTCDPQNATSSQACHTATQQARPGSR
jgi:hypothetical protein